MKERKRQKRSRVAERMEAEGSSVGHQMDKTQSDAKHGDSADTRAPRTRTCTAPILCCSVLSSSHPNYNAAYTTCPFARTTATCIYKHDE